MTIKVGGGGGGLFLPKFTSGTISLAAGNSGVLFTLTPPSGERARLNGLASTSPVEVDVTVKVGGVTVINAQRLRTDGAQAGEFQIGISAGTAESNTHYGDIPYMIGGIDEVIEVSAAGTTVGQTRYAYQTGNFK